MTILTKQENEESIPINAAQSSATPSVPETVSRNSEAVGNRPAVRQFLIFTFVTKYEHYSEDKLKLYLISFLTFVQGGDAEANLKKSVDEIRKLNEEISAARQDNLALKVIYTSIP